MARETVLKATILVREEQGIENPVYDTASLQGAVEKAIRGVGVDEVTVSVDSFREYQVTTRHDLLLTILRMKEYRGSGPTFDEAFEEAMTLLKEIPS